MNYINPETENVKQLRRIKRRKEIRTQVFECITCLLMFAFFYLMMIATS
jgi:hypothetical protein